jgi:hypothetical protein
VWKVAALVAVPFLILLAYSVLKPRDYYTGTNSVEAYTYIVETPVGHQVCVPGLEIPAGTARVRLMLISRTRTRPQLRMVMHVGTQGPAAESVLAPAGTAANRISAAVFAIPRVPAHPSESLASLCLTASDVVNWGGTPLTAPPSVAAPTIDGTPIAGRIAVWYLPAAGVRSSFLARAPSILQRASLFRPAAVGVWTYVLMMLLVLPGLALASVRCMAVAAGARVEGVPAAWSARRAGAWLFAIAAVNFACWALITPPFQAPDEVDHFAYTQSLVERGSAPSASAASPLPRWSSEESLALESMSFNTDHQFGDTRVPWTASQQARYRALVGARHPRSSDGGGNETAATHAALYYAALAPAYAAASASPFSQLTLMRLTSALIGALTVLFAFLLARELAPGRPWLAVLAALLVAYQPMYGFISGSVNNDVGVNAAAAGLELLLIVILRRGVTLGLGLLTGALLVALPIIKGTGLSLYPVAAMLLLATMWRHHSRSDLRGWLALVIGAVLTSVVLFLVLAGLQPSGATTGAAAVGPSASAVSEATHHLPEFASYLWQSILPRLPFMAHHFPPPAVPGFVLLTDPGFVIFVERGWAAFGWYDVFFPKWVYIVVLLAMLSTAALGVRAAQREWVWVRRNTIEVVALVLMPLAVVAGFEAAYFTLLPRAAIAEFGRYTFPAIAPLAVLVVGALHAFGRRLMLTVSVGLLVAMVALSYASQLVTLSSFYA